MFAPRIRLRAFSSVAAGAAGIGLILTLGASGGATASDPARTPVAPQATARTPALRMPPARRPRATASCSGATASGTGAFDSTSEFSTNKSATAAFGGSNLAASGYSGTFEGSGNTICDYNSVIVGGNGDTIDSGSGNTPAGAAYSMIGAGTSNNVSNYESFIGAGDTNSVSSFDSFVGAGLGNSVSSFDSFVGAGLGNSVPGTVSFIGSGHNNAVSGHLSFVGAGFGNQVSGAGSFVGAGGDVTSALPNNQISGSDSFVGAGDQNNIAANQAFIGSGQANQILTGGQFATIGGGNGNVASGSYGAIGGGSGNVASGAYGAIGGGAVNGASGAYATIPGGYHNVAAGVTSFAAGYIAEALTTGSFAWSDESSRTVLVRTTVPNEFVARATGGVNFYSNAALTSGVRLAPGAGSWSSLSDRAMKTSVVPLDDAAVLAKVAALPVSEWSYTSERGVRHVGPMAQDFYAAFGIGEDDRHITSIDEDGVALAAIKALHGENAALRAGMHSQHTELVALRGELRRLEAEVASTRSR